MAADLQGLARALIGSGLILAGGGLALLLAPKIPWLGRLPGDLLIERSHVRFYVPLTSCLVASLLLSAAWWVCTRIFR